jgi:hypothetical protein
MFLKEVPETSLTLMKVDNFRMTSVLLHLAM